MWKILEKIRLREVFVCGFRNGVRYWSKLILMERGRKLEVVRCGGVIGGLEGLVIVGGGVRDRGVRGVGCFMEKSGVRG